MAGAPDVLTSKWQGQSTTDVGTDIVAMKLRSQIVAQQIPVFQSAYQFSVPSRQWNMGWKSPDIPTVAGPTYAQPSSAPDVQYTQKSYRSLVAKSATPQLQPNRATHQLTAPSIETTY